MSYTALFSGIIKYLYMYLKEVIFEILEVNVPLAEVDEHWANVGVQIIQVLNCYFNGLQFKM